MKEKENKRRKWKRKLKKKLQEYTRTRTTAEIRKIKKILKKKDERKC